MEAQAGFAKDAQVAANNLLYAQYYFQRSLSATAITVKGDTGVNTCTGDSLCVPKT